LRAEVYKDSALKSLSNVLKHLSKNVNINDVGAVKGFIAGKNNENYKVKLCQYYALYCLYAGLEFEKPKYRRVDPVPLVPIENDIDALIGGLTKKHSTFVKTIKETGARPNEAWAIKWTDVNPQNNTTFWSICLLFLFMFFRERGVSNFMDV